MEESARRRAPGDQCSDEKPHLRAGMCTRGDGRRAGSRPGRGAHRPKEAGGNDRPTWEDISLESQDTKSVGTAFPYQRSTTQAVSQARGPGVALPVGGARGMTSGPAAAVARWGGRGSPRDCPNTRPRGTRVLLAGDASRCEVGLLRILLRTAEEGKGLRGTPTPVYSWGADGTVGH